MVASRGGRGWAVEAAGSGRYAVSCYACLSEHAANSLSSIIWHQPSILLDASISWCAVSIVLPGCCRCSWPHLGPPHLAAAASGTPAPAPALPLSLFLTHTYLRTYIQAVDPFSPPPGFTFSPEHLTGLNSRERKQFLPPSTNGAPSAAALAPRPAAPDTPAMPPNLNADVATNTCGGGGSAELRALLASAAHRPLQAAADGGPGGGHCSVEQQAQGQMGEHRKVSRPAAHATRLCVHADDGIVLWQRVCAICIVHNNNNSKVTNLAPCPCCCPCPPPRLGPACRALPGLGLQVLVVFFGDRSFAWLYKDELLPFKEHQQAKTGEIRCGVQCDFPGRPWLAAFRRFFLRRAHQGDPPNLCAATPPYLRRVVQMRCAGC